jgi:hypothetical protein
VERGHRHEVFSKPFDIRREQRLDPACVFCGQQQTGMVAFGKPRDDLRVLISGKIGSLLPGETKDHASIDVLSPGQLVGLPAACHLDACPFPPEIHVRSSFHHFINIGTADPGGTFQKVEPAISMRLDELRMRDPTHQPQRSDERAIGFLQLTRLCRDAWDETGCKDPALVRHFHWRSPIFADRREEHLLL